MVSDFHNVCKCRTKLCHSAIPVVFFLLPIVEMDQDRRSRLMRITVTPRGGERGEEDNRFKNEKRGLVIRGDGDFE